MFTRPQKRLQHKIYLWNFWLRWHPFSGDILFVLVLRTYKRLKSTVRLRSTEMIGNIRFVNSPCAAVAHLLYHLNKSGHTCNQYFFMWHIKIKSHSLKALSTCVYSFLVGILHTAICSGVHESRLTDFTFEICTPRFLWIPAHRMHKNIPKFQDAHLGPKTKRMHSNNLFAKLKIIIVYVPLRQKRLAAQQVYLSVIETRVCFKLLKFPKILHPNTFYTI